MRTENEGLSDGRTSEEGSSDGELNEEGASDGRVSEEGGSDGEVNEEGGSDGRANDDECLAVWCRGDEWCAVTCTIELIGKKWHPVIVHRLLEHGSLHFNELADELPATTNKVLSESLEDLEEKGLVDRTVVQDKPVRVTYSLTERGESLESVIDALESWGTEHLRPAADADESVC